MAQNNAKTVKNRDVSSKKTHQNLDLFALAYSRKAIFLLITYFAS